MFGNPYSPPTRFNIEQPISKPFKAVITMDDGHHEVLRHCTSFTPRECMVTIVDQYGIIHNFSAFHFTKIKVTYEKEEKEE